MLRENTAELRGLLRTIEKQAAKLELVELNPWIWDDPDCVLALDKNDLYLAVLYHWRNQGEIDFIVGDPGYSLDFTARVLTLDQLSIDKDFSVDFFVDVAKRQLAADYGRSSPESAWDLLTDAELESFGEFLEDAAEADRSQGGG